MNENNNLKKRTFTRTHGLIFMLILVLIPAIVFAVMFGFQMRRDSEPSASNTYTTIVIDPKRNVRQLKTEIFFE